jgi:hypothetical protein
LNYYRDYFSSKKLSKYIDEVFNIVGLEAVVMTNDPFDKHEVRYWEESLAVDNRFKAALRLDCLLNSWETACAELAELGYRVSPDLSGETLCEISRFLAHWIDKINPLYFAASLPPDFTMNTDSPRTSIIENCVLPVCKKFRLPFALMIGVRRGVNPHMKLAGDSLDRCDVKVIEYLCSKYPENKFLVTLLSLENQHQLIVTARKFKNLMLFGCWWFLNNPSIIESLTEMRIELLGTSFIPQHSDCRVFEQLISKWDHSKKIISKVLFNKYKNLMDTGYKLTREQVERDIRKFFGENFWEFIN